MKLLFLLALLNMAFAFSKKPTQPVPTPTTPKTDIEALAANSACAKLNWKDRSPAPIGYIKGVAAIYLRHLCKSDTPLAQAMSKPIGQGSKDALKHYGVTANTPGEIYRELFVLMFGLGMRESSGRYCTGRDMSASNVTASTAEAGLFQASFNSVGADPELKALFQKYDASSSGCLLDTFKEGVKPCKASDANNYGAGNGRRFQELSKSCPAFAAEWAAILLRNLRAHFGPINRLEAQMKPECRSMLKEIESAVKSNPALCSSI